MRTQQGFTLMELMMTIAIIGVIIGVAVPSYNSFRSTSIRADECIKTLSMVAFQAEKYKGRENTYPATMAAMNMASTSSEGNYTFNIGAGPTGDIRTSYSASCQPINADIDPSCGTLTIDNFGARSATGGIDCWR